MRTLSISRLPTSVLCFKSRRRDLRIIALNGDRSYSFSSRSMQIRIVELHERPG